MTKIFIAHSMGLKRKVAEYVKILEQQGHKVFFPARDTEQITYTETQILKANLNGVKWCEEVHVFWDGSSHGTIFDLGSAFALGKLIKVVYVPQRHWLFWLHRKLGGIIEQ